MAKQFILDLIKAMTLEEKAADSQLLQNNHLVYRKQSYPKHFYEEIFYVLDYLYSIVYLPKLWGEYGFYDAYNLDVTPEWYSDRVIGIDKGISLVTFFTEF